MPIPLLFLGAATLTGAVGIGKSAKAIHDRHDANETNELAQDTIDRAKEKATDARDYCGKSIANLGQAKVNVLDESMLAFIENFEKLHNVELEDSYGMNELKKFRIDKQSAAELREMQSAASSIAAGVGTGAVAGALTAFGAYSAAGALATASTGTAIATLSGAAATNATLAFFGGGSLAAGGLGIAGGTAVLGGLVAGPALAVMGFIVGAKAKKSREEAYANLAKAEEFEEEMNAVVTLSNGIRRRANMLERLLLKLDCLFDPLVYSLNQIIEHSGTDYSKFTAEEKNTVAASMSMAGAIKAVLDTPLLTDDGQLTPESEKIFDTMQPVLKLHE